jgi:protein-S-isoprenylcysteine O-methyltransferase Ste14
MAPDLGPANNGMNGLTKPLTAAAGILSAAFLQVGVPAMAWGNWTGLFAHPARRFACGALLITAVLTIFSGFNADSGRREDVHNRWVFLPSAALALTLMWIPAFADRRNMMTIDGNTVRYFGLVLLTAGCVLRVGAAFALGHRFTVLVAIQENHRLVTTGLYRFVRHPAYLGAIVGALGWVLVFRSGIGLLLVPMVGLLLLFRIASEERLLADEFGPEYVKYERNTWRLIPLLH